MQISSDSSSRAALTSSVPAPVAEAGEGREARPDNEAAEAVRAPSNAPLPSYQGTQVDLTA